ncbi:hypothetical protein [Streptomyces sp. NPDC026092]|uniref:hypothetical protein n=1 Tax=Streptomyces sp. NPDC026092 TaxID=3154797 RepID=UPI0033C890FE
MSGDVREAGEHRDRVLVRRWREPHEEAVLRDTPIAVLQQVRFWGGIAIAVAIKWPVIMTGDDVDGNLLAAWARDSGLRLLLVPFLLLVTAPLVVAAHFLILRPPAGGALGGRLRGPLTAAGAFLGHLLMTAGGVTGALWVSTKDFEKQPILSGLAILVCLYVGLRRIGFLYFAVPAISRHMFRTIEIHPAFPALITVALAWELTLQDLLFPLAEFPGVPFLLPLGGAVATTAVAGVELWRLRAAHGMRFRRLTRPVTPPRD